MILTRLDVLRADRDDAHATVARLREALATTERRRALEIRTRLDLADDIRRTTAHIRAHPRARSRDRGRGGGRSCDLGPGRDGLERPRAGSHRRGCAYGAEAGTATDEGGRDMTMQSWYVTDDVDLGFGAVEEASRVRVEP